MNTIFTNSESSNTSESYVLILRLTDKLDLGRREKSMALSNLRIYYAWKNIKSQKNELKILAPTGNDKLELPDGLYSVPDVQDYCEYI